MARQLAALCTNASPHNLNRLHFAALMDSWNRQWRAATIYQYRGELMHLAKFIGEQTGRPNLHLDVPKARQPQQRETIATPEEIEQLKAVSKSWMRLYITIVCNTALRRGDVLTLSQANIASDDTGAFLTVLQEKTKKRFALPLTPDLAQAIAALPPADNPATPFLQRAAGKPVTKQMFDHEWIATKRRAQVNPELTGHDLRRTVADILYDTSKDLRVVQQVLGHRSLASTLWYLGHKDANKLRPLLAQLWTPKGPVQ